MLTSTPTLMTRSCRPTCGVSASTMTTAGRRLEMCITDVRHWVAANRLKLNADKTELLWAGSKYGSTLLGSSGPPLRLGDETITASDHVRLLGVTISSDLSPMKHVGTISSSCFYCVRSEEYDDHLMLSLRRLSCMPSKMW